MGTAGLVAAGNCGSRANTESADTPKPPLASGPGHRTDWLPKDGTPDLDEEYVKKNRAVVAQQLKKGGVRLAKILNDALSTSAP